MTVLITGSAGKTASHLAGALSPDTKILVASRKPNASSQYPGVQFDWLDKTTWSNPFDHLDTQDSPISAVYLCVPDLPEARANAIPFVRFAIERAVRRFVLLSAWEVPEGGPLVGEVHAELRAVGETEGIAWTVLRPHFFMENFIETYHQETIKAERKIYSGAGNGKKPFIAARDIAAVAREALVSEKPHNTDHVITGSELLSYTDIANIVSEVLGTKIEHVSLPPDAFRAKLTAFGVSADNAEYLAELDKRVSQGLTTLDNKESHAVQQLTGSAPLTFREFAQQNRQKWQ